MRHDDGAWLTPTYERIAAFERSLGDPFDPGSVLSFADAIELDECEQISQVPFDAFMNLAFLAPQSDGGQFTTFEEALGMVRALSRRDWVVTLGIGATMLGAIPVWVWGTPEQRASLGRHLAAGHYGAFAVSEAETGSDLMGSGTRAVADHDGYVLDGQKWPIGNATRASFAVVLASAAPHLTMFYADLDAIGPPAVTRLPKVRTVGLRGYDLSGISFDGCQLMDADVVGRRGRGAQMVLGTLQYTRTMVAGMCLGAADTAMRLGLQWAGTRRLYGDSLHALDPIRELLLDCYLDLLICDCVTISAARALTAATPGMTLWAAVVKLFVPLTTERIVRDLSVVLSARSYFREGFADGLFQKVARDIAIGSIFEGTTLTQLSAIANELKRVGERERAGGSEPLDRAVLSGIFALGQPAPVWHPDSMRPRMTAGGRDEIAAGWIDAVERLQGATGDGPRTGRIAGQVRSLSHELLAERQRVLAELSNVSVGPMRTSFGGVARRGFALAREHCLLHAAAACVQVWTHSRESLEPGLADGAWVVLALARLRDQLAPAPLSAGSDATHDHEREVYELMLRAARENRAFSVMPFRLA